MIHICTYSNEKEVTENDPSAISIPNLSCNEVYLDPDPDRKSKMLKISMIVEIVQKDPVRVINIDYALNES